MWEGTLERRAGQWSWTVGLGGQLPDAAAAIREGVEAAQETVVRLLKYEVSSWPRVTVVLKNANGSAPRVEGHSEFRATQAAGGGAIYVPVMTIVIGGGNAVSQSILPAIKERARHEMGHLLLACATGQGGWARGREAEPLPDWLASAIEWDHDSRIPELADLLLNQPWRGWTVTASRVEFHRGDLYPDAFQGKFDAMNIAPAQADSVREAAIGRAILKMTEACPQVSASAQLRMLLTSYKRFKEGNSSCGSPLQGGRLSFIMTTDRLGSERTWLSSIAKVGMMASILQIEDHHSRAWGALVGACVCSGSPYVVVAEGRPSPATSTPVALRLATALGGAAGSGIGVADSWRRTLWMDQGLDLEARVCWARALVRALAANWLADENQLLEMQHDKGINGRWSPAVVLFGEHRELAAAWREAWSRLKSQLKLLNLDGTDNRFTSWLPALLPSSADNDIPATSGVVESTYRPILAVYLDELTPDLLARAREFAATRVVWSAVFPAGPDRVLCVRPYEELQEVPRAALDPRYREDAWELPTREYSTIDAEVLSVTEGGRLTTPLSWLLAFLRIGFVEDFPAEMEV